MINTKDKPKCLSVEDFKLTLDFISKQDIKLWKKMKCPFEECSFTQTTPNASNLRKHTKKCKFSPGYKNYKKSDDTLMDELTSLKPCEIEDNPLIIRGDWGYRYGGKSDPENLYGLFYFLKREYSDWSKRGDKDQNFVLKCLSTIININNRFENLSQSVKVKDKKIYFYFENKWISKQNYEEEWVDQKDKLVKLFYEKVEEICESRYMMFTDFTGFNLKLLKDIGKPETEKNIEQKIEIYTEEKFPIPRQTLYDGPILSTEEVS